MTPKGARVLVVDDEVQIRRLLKVALSAHGLEVAEAANGQEGLEQAVNFQPDLVILDMGLPDLDGLEVIRRLREWTAVPIIILSVREAEKDKIRALDAGADDYVTKPFSMGEVLARLRVALRHAAKTEEEPVLVAGDISIDLARRQVFVDGKEVRLTPTEYGILKNLAVHAGKILTHRHLLKLIWGEEYAEETHYLRVYVRQLRRKIEPDPAQPRYILTEPGVGYRLAVRDEANADPQFPGQQSS
jgi:two-component system KDP operon response regulator KdpE